jgi:hypothetical protein
MTTVSTPDRSRAAAGSAGYLPTPSELGNMAARGGVRPTTPPELGNMVPQGGPTYPPRIREHGALGSPTYSLGIAERWHRNLPSLAKKRNHVGLHVVDFYHYM